MATCLLPELLNQETFFNKNVLWIPLRDTNFLFNEDPDETILKLLSKHNQLPVPIDIWSQDAGIDWELTVLYLMVLMKLYISQEIIIK